MHRLAGRAAIGILAIICFAGVPAPAVALDTLPELRFGRIAPVTVTLPSAVQVGAQALGTSLDDRSAFSGQLALAYSHRITGGYGIQVGLFGTQAGTGSRSLTRFGHMRLANGWQSGRVHLIGGVDLWLDHGGLASWLDAPSPWGAFSWTRSNHGLGISVAWDRTDQFGRTDLLFNWAEDARPGLRPAITYAGSWGPVDGALTFVARIDDGELAGETLALDLAWPFAFDGGDLSAGLMLRSNLDHGRSDYPFTGGLVLRGAFDIQAIGDNAQPADDAGADFDPFGGSGW